MPAQIFKNRVFTAAGPLPGQLTVDNLKRWTTLRKGVFLEDFDDGVTHLLCTKEQFDKKVPKVRQALKRGKGFHIVHCDWFEFSTAQNKRLPEVEYSMRSLVAKEMAKKREKERAEKGKRDAEKFVNTSHYHLYRDRVNFVYQIDLTRDNEFTGELGQKYTLCLWESNAKPHLYWFTAKFLKRKGSSQPSYHRPSPHEGKWDHEMNQFMDFFKIKTGIEWPDRVTLAHTMPSSYFQYTPPTGGKPVGRRLKFDIDYCREINAGLRGLPWPPVEDSEATKEASDSDADSGPRIFDDEDKVMTPPPESELVPQEGQGFSVDKQPDSSQSEQVSEGHVSGIGMQPDETKPHGNELEDSLEVSPKGMGVECVTPSPGGDESDALEPSEGAGATSIEEPDKSESSLESEVLEPEAIEHEILPEILE
ncbi:hypothetical protein F66182_11 [Fusarium sp. NRRL 66182]|nr:hypothetical protein F66182_11 [Fusarium sp. NRRL 66182]